MGSRSPRAADGIRPSAAAHWDPRSGQPWQAGRRLGVAAVMVGTVTGGSVAYADAAHADAKAAPDASVEAKAAPSDVRIAGFPIVGYAPETSLLLGAVAVPTFWHGDAPRGASGRNQPSSTAVAVVASLNKQLAIELSPSLFFDQDKWHVWGRFAFVHLPQTFWGVGNATAESAREGFTERLFGTSVATTRQVISHLGVGFAAQARHRAFSSTKAGGLIETGAVPGSEGGWEIGIGPVVAWETRDNDFATRRGGRYEVSATVNDGALASDHDYISIIADARHFFTLPWGHVVGLHASSDVEVGTPPFQSLAALGGGNIMRGLYAGRLRDKNAVQAQVEYRLPIAWRFGAAAFAASGETAPTLAGLALDRLTHAAGAGLRFALSAEERVNLRLDIAHATTGETNAYFTLGEAF